MIRMISEQRRSQRYVKSDSGTRAVRFAMLAAATMAIPFSISIPSPASAQLTPSTGLVEDCMGFRYGGRTLGECVSTRTVRDALAVPGAGPLQCELLQDIAPDFFEATWDSYDECVRDLSSEFRSE